MIGVTVGNYRVVAKIGDGGMGTVYRALDEMLDRDVALKVMKPELTRQAALHERFRQEAVALARLHHPNIATVFGMERHEDNMVMVMEFIRGETLESIVSRSGPLDWGRALQLCHEVLAALDHAHDKGVVHRDIKPANIMLAHDGVIKVMDFGIARIMGRSRQTRVGHAVGTPTYMSPEQLKGEEVDGRSDLYSLGAVLYELITGRMAFEADSDYALMMKQLHDPPPPPSGAVADVPSPVDAIVQRAMAKQRADRFNNAPDMRRAVDVVLASRKPAEHKAAPATRLPAYSAPETGFYLFADGDSSGSVGAASDHVVLPVAAATRLASGAPVTRLAHNDGDAPTPTGAGRQFAFSVTGVTRWSSDWRAWTGIAALLLAITVAVRSSPDDKQLTQPATDTPSSQASQTLASDRPSSQQVSPVDRTEGVTAAAITPPAGAGPATVRSQNQPSSGIDVSGLRTADEISRVPSPGGPRTLPRQPAPNRPDAPAAVESRPVTPVETAERAPDADEIAVDAAAAITEALGAFGAAVGSGQTGRVDGVLRGDGSFVADWLGLMREGRLSMVISRQPAVDVRGARASAGFGAEISVRSPFGANRRRSAEFVAELSRNGRTWRVVSVRPVGSVNLK